MNNLESKLNYKSKAIKKEAFDKIYRRFMDEKQTKEQKVEEQRRIALLEKEQELYKIEQVRKGKKGTKRDVDSYVEKVQRDIKERQYKAEKRKQQLALDEQKELSKLFKPKTNIK